MTILQRAAVLAVALACGTATGAAVAAPSSGHVPLAPHVRKPPAVPIDPLAESKFVPITPCRIVDTRKDADGPLVGGHSRSFYGKGSYGMAGQGGATDGCGIPDEATAIDVSFQATRSTGSGYVNETAQSSSFALTSLLHLVKGQTVGTGSTFPVSGSAGSYSFKLQASSGKTDVLVDVLGYYIAPMFAVVNADYTVAAASRVLSVHGGGGIDTIYLVDFDRSVVHCAYSVTAVANFEGDYGTAFGNKSVPDEVAVRIHNAQDVVTDGAFTLTVTC